MSESNEVTVQEVSAVIEKATRTNNPREVISLYNLKAELSIICD